MDENASMLRIASYYVSGAWWCWVLIGHTAQFNFSRQRRVRMDGRPYSIFFPLFLTMPNTCAVMGNCHGRKSDVILRKGCSNINVVYVVKGKIWKSMLDENGGNNIELILHNSYQFCMITEIQGMYKYIHQKKTNYISFLCAATVFYYSSSSNIGIRFLF